MAARKGVENCEAPRMGAAQPGHVEVLTAATAAAGKGGIARGARSSLERRAAAPDCGLMRPRAGLRLLQDLSITSPSAELHGAYGTPRLLCDSRG